MQPCWGIGLGRTGTNSFCEALRMLGYDRVKHNPPFEELGDLQGGADNGVTVFYKYLDARHPGSKFVLMLRDLEDWLESMRVTAARFPLPPTANDAAMMRRMLLYEAVVFDNELFTEAYHRHHADVRRYFAGRPDDLIEMRITDGEGWPRLCRHPELPPPDAAFPHLFARPSGDGTAPKQRRFGEIMP